MQSFSEKIKTPKKEKNYEGEKQKKKEKYKPDYSKQRKAKRNED